MKALLAWTAVLLALLLGAWAVLGSSNARRAAPAAPADFDAPGVAPLSGPGSAELSSCTDRTPSGPSEGRSTPPASFAARIEVCVQGPRDRCDFVQAPLRVLLRDTRGDSVALRVENGVWEGALALGSYSVLGVEGRERAYDFQSSARLTEATPSIRVEISEVDHWTLEVVDARTQAHLDAVTLITVADDVPQPIDVFMAWQDHPPPPEEGGHVLIDRETSPFRVRDDNVNGLYWAAAEGYLPRAFQRHRFQRRARVELQASGTLEIAVATFTEDVTRALRSGSVDRAVEVVVEGARPDARTWRSQVGGGEEIELQVAAGAHTVSARLVAPLQAGALVWSQAVDVPAGQSVRVQLELTGRSIEQAGASLTVFCVLPQHDSDVSAWKLRGRARAEGEERWHWIGEDSGDRWTPLEDGVSFARTLDGLAPGEYRFDLLPARLQRTIVLTPGPSELILDASGSAEVHVSVSRPEPSHAEARVRWGIVGDEDAGFEGVAVDPSGFARFRCAPVPIWIRAISTDAVSDLVELAPKAAGVTSASLSLERELLAGVRVSLWEQGSHAFVESAVWDGASVEALGHSGRLVRKLFGPHETSVELAKGARRPDWSQAVLHLSPPGRYRLRFDGFPGRSIEFDAAAGISELAFDLR